MCSDLVKMRAEALCTWCSREGPPIFWTAVLQRPELQRDYNIILSHISVFEMLIHLRSCSDFLRHLVSFCMCVFVCVCISGPWGGLCSRGQWGLHRSLSAHTAGHRLHPQWAHCGGSVSLSLLYTQGKWVRVRHSQCVSVCTYTSTKP